MFDEIVCKLFDSKALLWVRAMARVRVRIRVGVRAKPFLVFAHVAVQKLWLLAFEC